MEQNLFHYISFQIDRSNEIKKDYAKKKKKEKWKKEIMLITMWQESWEIRFSLLRGRNKWERRDIIRDAPGFMIRSIRINLYKSSKRTFGDYN